MKRRFIIKIISYVVGFLLATLIFKIIDNNANLNEEYSQRIIANEDNNPYLKEGFRISNPYNGNLLQNSEVNTFIQSVGNIPTEFISNYYYMGNPNTENVYFFIINTWDLSKLFETPESTRIMDSSPITPAVLEDRIYKSYLGGVPDEVDATNTSFQNFPATTYFFDKDMGDDLFIPTKAIIICKNKKAYHIEVSAIDVDYWYDKVLSSISIVTTK